MAWIIVPLQYLFLIYRAQKFTAKATLTAGTAKHSRYLKKAVKATLACEQMQIQFPAVTNWIDIRRNEEALRFEMSK